MKRWRCLHFPNKNVSRLKRRIIPILNDRCYSRLMPASSPLVCLTQLSHLHNFPFFSTAVVCIPRFPIMTHNKRRIEQIARRILMLDEQGRSRLSNICSSRVWMYAFPIIYEIGIHEFKQLRECVSCESHSLSPSRSDVFTPFAASGLLPHRAPSKLNRDITGIFPNWWKQS